MQNISLLYHREKNVAVDVVSILCLKKKNPIVFISLSPEGRPLLFCVFVCLRFC